MYGWCNKCRAIAIEGICSKHGNTTPLPFIAAVDVRPLSPFEKQFFNDRMSGLILGNGVFLLYADRIRRRMLIFRDIPLAEIQFRRGNVLINLLAKGHIEGMEIEPFITTNCSRLRRMSEVSESFAEQLVQQIPNAVISYSGGKDSAVLGDILTRFGLTKVFIDTGLEFSETYEYIDKLRAEGHKIDIVRASTSFYSLVKEKGFPKAGNRWCCKTQKFEPFSRYIGERYSNQDVIVFIAERRCEAAYRTSEPFVRRHRYIPNQLTAQPLLDWLTLDIWNHIWTKGLSINPVYEFFDRSGCWLCPFGLQHRIFLLEFSHPKLHKLLLSMRLTKLKQEKERGAFANKKPCTMLLEGKRVKTCNVYGHFYVDSICHRCGLAEGSVPGVSTTTSAPEPEPLKPP